MYNKKFFFDSIFYSSPRALARTRFELVKNKTVNLELGVLVLVVLIAPENAGAVSHQKTKPRRTYLKGNKAAFSNFLF